MKKTCSSLHLGITHSLLFYMALLIIMPQRHPLYPIIIWSGMIILSGLIIHNHWNKKSPIQPAMHLQKSYKKVQDMALLSAFLFLLTCISFKFVNHIEYIIPNTLILITTLCVIYTILFHIKSFDNKKNIFRKIKPGIKYSWVIVSLISYYLARLVLSNAFDIPFEVTSNKLITAVFALISILMFYYAIYFIFTPYLIFIAPKIKKRKAVPSDDISHSMSVFFPLFLIGFISYIAFSVQTFSIIKFGFEFAMKYDTRDTFFCKNKYMWLNKHSKARFMFISEGNYRVLIPHRDDFTISRLTCTNNEPFYSLVTVQDKKDFMLETLEKQAEILTHDLKRAMSPNVR